MDESRHSPLVSTFNSWYHYCRINGTLSSVSRYISTDPCRAARCSGCHTGTGCWPVGAATDSRSTTIKNCQISRGVTPHPNLKPAASTSRYCRRSRTREYGVGVRAGHCGHCSFDEGPTFAWREERCNLPLHMKSAGETHRLSTLLFIFIHHHNSRKSNNNR